MMLLPIIVILLLVVLIASVLNPTAVGERLARFRRRAGVILLLWACGMAAILALGLAGIID